MSDVRAQPVPVRPPLKWPGGKRWQVPFLRELWQPHRHQRLVEPFCGGLAVSLGLQPANALLNDSNPHVISFYQWLKRGLTVDVRLRYDRLEYYRRRRKFNRLLRTGHGASREAAVLFYYLNRSGYNGLCRFNASGEFNVPFGQYTAIRYARDFLPYVEALANWEFTSVDFDALAIKPDDFVYADPPYDVPFTRYGRAGFSWDDQQRVAASLTRHSGPVILVNQATTRIEDLYRSLGYEVQFLEAPRRISCTGDRTPAREIVATRNL